MKKWKRLKENQGSSLLFVIIAIAFVAILGTLISQLTFINIQMKSTDRKAKTTFYTNETALNELQIALEDISGEAMSKAYIKIVENYANITDDNSQSLQSQFTYEYVKNLVQMLTKSTDENILKQENLCYVPSVIKGKMNSIFQADNESTGVSPSTWFKNTDELSKANKLEWVIDNTKSGNSYVVLRDISVAYDTETDKNHYKNDTGATAHMSTITTDIKLTVPPLNFQSGIYPSYTTYAIIANRNMITKGAGIKVNGDLYGSAGILVESGNASFTGPKTTNIVTRGDFLVSQGASAIISGENPDTSADSTVSTDDYVRVWANNFGTTKSGSIGTTTAETNLELTGDAFIQDDLILNANSSNVTIKGNKFYGFGYNKLNQSMDAMTATEKRNSFNSEYSSAITINGKNVSLDMENVNSMMLAGRAYISREQENSTMEAVTDMKDKNNINRYQPNSKDIMTGEGVSFKSNQLAYLIPADAVTGGMNPMPASKYIELVNDDKEVVDKGKLRDKREYLSANYYTQYCYNIKNAGSYVYFYYDFRNDAKANEYFETYLNDKKNKATLESKLKSSGFINNSKGVTLSSNLNVLAAACTGNILSVEETGNLTLTKPNQSPDGDLTELLNDAISKAKEYYSMQIALNPDSAKPEGNVATGVNFRIEEVEGVDGSKNERKALNNPIYNIIVKGFKEFEDEANNSEIASGTNKYGFATSSDYKIKKVAIPEGMIPETSKSGSEIENKKVGVFCIYANKDQTVKITEDLLKIDDHIRNKGIILASCNVEMGANFEGTVISQSDIIMKDPGITLTADTQLVQHILTYAQKSITDTKQQFAHYFGLSNAEADLDDPKAIDISAYVSYSNWRNKEPETK